MSEEKISWPLLGAGIGGVLALGVSTYLLLREDERLHHDYERYFKVEEGDVVFEIGTEKGSFAKSVLDKASMIVIIEPNPFYVAKLCRRFSGNPKVHILEMAVWDRRTILPIYLKGLASSPFQGEGDYVLVCADTLDNIVKELGIQRIDFLRVDVEGSEIELLKGARKTLDMVRKVVIAVYHTNRPDIKPTYPWVEAFLRRAGFETIVDEGLVYATRTQR